MELLRFRLRSGMHIYNDVDPITGEEKTENGQPVERIARKGDIVLSRDNLYRRFPEKFIPMDALSAGEIASAPSPVPSSEYGGLSEELENYTVEELRLYAADNAVDLKGASRKDDIIKRISDAIASR